MGINTNRSFLDQLFNLEGKVALLTGAGGMLCGVFAEAFARAGCHVVVTDRDEASARRTAQKLEGLGGKVMALQLDVTRKGEHEAVRDQVLPRLERVDILVNGAGINFPTPLADLGEGEWDEIQACHVKGTLFACQVFGPVMIAQGGGSIINISSEAAGPPLSKAFAYSVAKAGISNLTQNLAREWAPSGVRVNALKPGFFPTEYSKKHFIDETRERAIMGHTPMKRYGHPSELVGAVLYLASDASSFVTGAHMIVDGGFSAMTI